MVSWIRLSFIALNAVFLTGCVSSALESEDFQSATPSTNQSQTASGSPNQLVPASTSLTDGTTGEGVDPLARREAVIEMREKANNGSGEKTKFGLLPETANEQLSASDQDRLSSELEQDAEAAQSEVSDEELQAKQDSIRLLRKKAQSHYKEAITTIEN